MEEDEELCEEDEELCEEDEELCEEDEELAIPHCNNLCKRSRIYC